MIKNILITGGAGYIGSHIAELLIKKKKKIFIIDNLSTGHRRLINRKAKFLLADIKNIKKVRKFIEKNNIECVIHLAAVLSVGESEKKPKKYFMNNVTGTSMLLKSLKNTNVKNFIFSSSCSVYKDGYQKVTEKTILRPKSVYGKTKLLAERIIMKYCKKNKLNYGILRFFNVVGASPSGKIGQINKYSDQLFKNLSIEIVKRNPLFKIYGDNYYTKDGTCIRDYIHVLDIAEIHSKVLEKIDKKNKSLTLNCGYSKGISVKKVINQFIRNSKHDVKVKILKKRKGDMSKIIADTTKLRKSIKWKPKYNNLSKIVKSCINWEKKL